MLYLPSTPLPPVRMQLTLTRPPLTLLAPPPVMLFHRPQMRAVFFFNDTATTEIYTLSLHDALPIYPAVEMSKVHPLLALSSHQKRAAQFWIAPPLAILRAQHLMIARAHV